MSWFDNDHEHTQAYNQVSLSFAKWYCVVLIATGSSSNPPPSTRLTSVMSSLLVLLPLRFDFVLFLFPAIFKHALLGCQGI